MTARANTSSGPKADGSHPVAYAILSGVAVGLFLPVIGLLLDSHDTYFNALLSVSLASGAIVAFFVWRRERQISAHGLRRTTKETGLDRKTLRRILNRKKVKASTFAKVIMGLREE